MTILETENLYLAKLSALYGEDEAKNMAWLAANHICRLSRSEYLAKKREPLSGMEETSLLQVLGELETGKPLQYVLGETEFYGLPFKVNPSVLIPRPETEELVDWVLKEVAGGKFQVPGLRILDMGTGSGCIPIALKKNLPEADVTALDISVAALETAIRNAVLNQAEVHFYNDDILNPKQRAVVDTKFDIIISNPPYVTLAEKTAMHRNVLEHEPHTALFVPDSDPLLFYDAIARFAVQHLNAEGFLFLEINENLGEETAALLRTKGFKNVELRRDLRDRHRMIKAGF